MLVKDYMTRHPLMADPTMSIMDAQRYMGENRIRHLPIVGDGKRLLGLVTPHSLLVDPGRIGSLDVWEIARYLSRLTVEQVMIKAQDVITIGPDMTIEEAARVMVEKKIGCLPVLDEGVLVGIFTETDLMAHLMNLMGAPICGIRVTVRMPDAKGELAKLVAAVAAQGWGILSLGGAFVPKEPDKWDAVIKINDAPKEQIVAALSKVEGQQIIDVREV
jgi:acetoin utilization protein AcuB